LAVLCYCFLRPPLRWLRRPQDAEAELGAALGAAFRAPGGQGGSALDWAALRLGSGGAFCLSLEALLLSDDGGALDALALAAKAALAHAALPQARSLSSCA